MDKETENNNQNEEQNIEKGNAPDANQGELQKILYYNHFQEKLQEALIKICKEKDYMGEHLLEVEELDEKWREMAPEYMVHAVPEFTKYPMVAVAWAAYLGMGAAVVWDTNWDEFKEKKDLYDFFVKPRGFDQLDDYIMEEFMGFKPDTEEYKSVASLFQSLAETALNMIRKENIEAQSNDAFHIFARTVKIMFKIGISVALKMLGYKYEKMTIKQ